MTKRHDDGLLYDDDGNLIYEELSPLAEEPEDKDD